MKIALLCHFSPPVHGAALVGDRVFALLSKRHQVYRHRLSDNRSLIQIGKIKFALLRELCQKLYWLIDVIFVKKVSAVYITPALDGNAYWRDVLLVLFVKVTRKLVRHRVHLLLHVHMRPRRARTKGLVWRLFVSNSELILLLPVLRQDFSCLPASTVLKYLGNCVDPLTRESPIIPGRLLYIGHLSMGKGIVFLIEQLKAAIGRYPNIYKDVSVDIAGTLLIDEKTFLKKIGLLQSLGMAVTYHGAVIGSDKAVLFSKAQLLIQPSFSEAQPLTIMEAFSIGLPVLARSVGGMAEMVTKRNGVLFSADEDFLINLNAALRHPFSQKDITADFNVLYTDKKFEAELENVFKDI